MFRVKTENNKNESRYMMLRIVSSILADDIRVLFILHRASVESQCFFYHPDPAKSPQDKIWERMREKMKKKKEQKERKKM